MEIGFTFSVLPVAVAPVQPDRADACFGRAKNIAVLVIANMHGLVGQSLGKVQHCFEYLGMRFLLAHIS